jgi:DNA-binding MarR family transcriptional regulator
VLDGMERSGLIRRARNAKDRRKINITLTPRGRALKDEILPYAAKINRRATRGMNAEEVAQLSRLLARVIENLER